ncbi:MAG TPA: hypothetical protein PKW15_03895, partial [Alphaproteobacteria bacterium]|nr:hypothetical protein [Alphaproteobacteria bacterium]
GGSDWQAAGFDPDSGQAAMDYFGLKQLFRYEPARGVDERQLADAVINFDVLEHIFIADLPAIIRDLFCHARKLLIVNVACYHAAAQLPNGENAHITVRPPLWWKGMFDSIAPEFPDVSVMLICSEGWRKSMAFDLFNAGKWHADDKFVIVN